MSDKISLKGIWGFGYHGVFDHEAKNGQDFYYPDFTSDLHYECELVYRINKAGKNIQAKFAHKYYSEMTLGIDFTARDLQQECKSKGLP